MRYELSDCEWSVIEPVLPKGRPGPRRKDDPRVLNGIFWVLRTGAPWRDDRLQPLQPVAQGRNLGPADGRRHQGPWRRSADDR